MNNFLPQEFFGFYNTVTRYMLTICLYTITIDANNGFKNKQDLDNIICATQNNIKILNNKEYETSLIEFYFLHKQKIQKIIEKILSKYIEYKNIINTKIEKTNFDSVTKIIQCVFILSYFEIKEIKLEKQKVIANYLTIINIFNFTKKEIGFTNKIIDMF